jgi:hypothetical protein
MSYDPTSHRDTNQAIQEYFTRGTGVSYCVLLLVVFNGSFAETEILEDDRENSTKRVPQLVS